MQNSSFAALILFFFNDMTNPTETAAITRTATSGQPCITMTAHIFSVGGPEGTEASNPGRVTAFSVNLR